MRASAPEVTIGVPAYRRPAELARCLAALSNQTYDAIRIIVADDASNDSRMVAVIEQACARDSRVTPLFRQTNLGVAASFADLMERAETPYFMLAGDDDYFVPEAVETLVGLLEADPSVSMACGATRQFNDQGISAPIAFTQLRSTGDRMADLERFLWAPEIEGKGGHPIYGLFRPSAARASAKAMSLGSKPRFNDDVMFVFAFLCRYNMTATDRPLLFKHTRSRRVDQRPRFFPSDYSFPRRHYAEYHDGLIEACATEEQRQLVRRVMRRRLLFKTLVSSWRKPLFRYFRARPVTTA